MRMGGFPLPCSSPPQIPSLYKEYLALLNKSWRLRQLLPLHKPGRYDYQSPSFPTFLTADPGPFQRFHIAGPNAFVLILLHCQFMSAGPPEDSKNKQNPAVSIPD